MRFSIIVPAHNSEKWLRKCLDSVKQQTFKDYELIVVCDSCTDSTEQIAREYTTIVESVDYGKDGLTRNYGLKLAKGDYILFLDSDDWFLHEYVFEILHEKLRENKNTDVLCFSFIIKGVMYATTRDDNGNFWTACWNKCYKRTFLNRISFSSVYYCSDVGFTNDVMSRFPRLVEWDMPLYYYNYLCDGSMSKDIEESKKK